MSTSPNCERALKKKNTVRPSNNPPRPTLTIIISEMILQEATAEVDEGCEGGSGTGHGGAYGHAES